MTHNGIAVRAADLSLAYADGRAAVAPAATSPTLTAPHATAPAGKVVARVWRMLQPYRRQTMVVLGLSLATVLIELAPPLLQKLPLLRKNNV